MCGRGDSILWQQRRESVDEETERGVNNDKMGGSGGKIDGVICGETIAVDVARLNVDECCEALGK